MPTPQSPTGRAGAAGAALFRIRTGLQKKACGSMLMAISSYFKGSSNEAKPNFKELKI
jgi:hypothetical protein